MASTKKQFQTYNGFAIPLQPDTDLDMAMLTAESDDGQHEPVAVVGTISEQNRRELSYRLVTGRDSPGGPPDRGAQLRVAHDPGGLQLGSVRPWRPFSAPPHSCSTAGQWERGHRGIRGPDGRRRCCRPFQFFSGTKVRQSDTQLHFL